MSSLKNTAVQHVTAANSVRYAYRRIGPADGIPLVMHGFFRSNMDFWDPLLIDSLAAVRPVIVFDNAGVGRTTGTIPTTYQGWADDEIAFIKTLGLDKVDILGFSMGGVVAQMVALTVPDLVRKVILAGTTASIPLPDSDVAGLVWPRESPLARPFSVLSTSGNDPSEVQNAIAVSFFYETESGRAACQAYWNRLHEGRAGSEPLLDTFVTAGGLANQIEARTHWDIPNPQNSFGRLQELEMPVLVLNGDHDVLVPPSRSWELAKKIPRAQLVIYPKAGHGFIYQYAELVAAHINLFLDGYGNFDEASKP